MGCLPRLRDAKLCYVTLLGAITVLYLVVVSELKWSQHESYWAEYGNLSRRNYQYAEVCREWKLAVEQESERNNGSVERSVPRMHLDDWDETFEPRSRFRCDNGLGRKQLAQRGTYYVIYNFVTAEKEYGCMESITLSAPGDYRFLDNVIPLVERWQGPVSVALYSPGDDFYTTLNAIAYLRNCETSLIRQLVTFHIIFEQDHTPKQRNGTVILDVYDDKYDCSLPPPWTLTNEDDSDMYKIKMGLLYPINVARNVAKLAAKTYFVFPSDIELYPTRNFVSLFLDFVRDNSYLFEPETRNVFVLPVFEILQNQTVPENKTQLLRMLKKKTAIIFHQGVCVVCHRVIESEKWVRSPETEGLGVFSVGKRTGRYMVWEPFFVCTQKEPLWDERMTWEGQNNKMVQAYTMCVMDYNFHVLDNAFLIHKPGVKKKKVQMEKFKPVVQRSMKLIKQVAVELQQIHGYSPNCSTAYKSVLTKKPKSITDKKTNR